MHSILHVAKCIEPVRNNTHNSIYFAEQILVYIALSTFTIWLSVK